MIRSASYCHNRHLLEADAFPLSGSEEFRLQIYQLVDIDISWVWCTPVVERQKKVMVAAVYCCCSQFVDLLMCVLKICITHVIYSKHSADVSSASSHCGDGSLLPSQLHCCG